MLPSRAPPYPGAYRYASDQSSRSRSNSSSVGLRRDKPELGIFIPNTLPVPSVLTPVSASSPVKRKPLPSSAAVNQAKPVQTPTAFPPRLSSLGTHARTPSARSFTDPASGRSIELVPRDLDRFPHGRTPPAVKPLQPNGTFASNGGVRASSNTRNLMRNYNTPALRNDQHKAQRLPTQNSISNQPHKMAPASLQIDVTREDGSSMIMTESPVPQSPLPKSPGLGIGSFFGWKPRGEESPASEPSKSPYLRQTKTMPSALDIPKANALAHGIFGGPLPVLPTPPASSVQVAELEQELREISTELASSIKREMELEDEVERLRSQFSELGSERERRTSDYFSDAGTTSSRYGEPDAKIEELEKSKRKTEMEKAQIKLDMSGKMAEVLKQRRIAEDRMHLLEEHVHHSRLPSPTPEAERIYQFEILLEEAKRKVHEERLARDNLEELIGGMRHELLEFKNERDNLRDEVVPQLESKLASLEMFVSEGEYFPSVDRTVDTIAEDMTFTLPQGPPQGLSRSKSTAGRRQLAGRTSRSNSIGAAGPARSRSNSIKELAHESREQLIERVRDMEVQREALHLALKNLLIRYQWETGVYAKKLQAVDLERERLQRSTPRRTAFQREVKTLRAEIALMRRRADEALEQKIQCEKGLGGLKIDLDRARQETGSLRRLLKQHDISLPPSSSGNAVARAAEAEEPLTKAYNELRTTHALSLAHLDDLRTAASTPRSSGNAAATIESANILTLLKKSISAAEAERDAARAQADKYRARARQLQASELSHEAAQHDLRAELFARATRMDALADDVRAQLDSNAALRSRLAGAVARGERDQRRAAETVAALQERLRSREDELLAAQAESEGAVAGHEEDVRRMKEGAVRGLSRRSAANSPAIGSGAWSAGQSALTSPALPALTEAAASVPGSPLLLAVGGGANGRPSPRIGVRSSVNGVSMREAAGGGALESRVRGLEAALTEAEGEMGVVVARMNAAQMEVAELQNERDDATQKSRRLQAEIVLEREKVASLMARLS